MIVTSSFKGDREFLTVLERMPPTVRKVLEVKIRTLALVLENHVKTGKLNGQVLNRISGRLARSISNKIEITENKIRAIVYSSSDVKYAGIHEYGGTIKHPGGTAYLPIGGGKAAFLSNSWASGYKGTPMPRTKPHNIVMPKRSFLRSSLKDLANRISTELKTVVVNAARGAT